MSRRWFGTDGIRGVANVDLTPELALRVGRAAVRALRSEAPPRVLVGRDTRLSGPVLGSAVAAGVAAEGGGAYLGGVLPTPAVARLVVTRGFDFGVVISASHNPYRDNGIKIFGPDGHKLSDDLEKRVEEEMEGGAVSSGPVGVIEEMVGAAPDYVEELLNTLDVDLSGVRVLLDCAQGAAFQVAPLAFRAAGAHVETICAQPDGTNINEGCGSTDIETLSSYVAQGDYDLGLAFDGDADRVLAVDAAGRSVDGDKIIAILALWLKKQGRLNGDRVVVTSMSNLGFHKAMEAEQVGVEVTEVGDRHVLTRMTEVSAVLGGEQSGHVIYLPAGPAGDGVQTGLLLARVVKAAGRPLSELAGVVVEYPQLLLNVEVERKEQLREAGAVWEALKSEEERLLGDGRIVIRPSGTEALVRIMVEAPTQDVCSEVARRLAEVVESELGRA